MPGMNAEHCPFGLYVEQSPVLNVLLVAFLPDSFFLPQPVKVARMAEKISNVGNAFIKDSLRLRRFSYRIGLMLYKTLGIFSSVANSERYCLDGDAISA